MTSFQDAWRDQEQVFTTPPQQTQAPQFRPPASPTVAHISNYNGLSAVTQRLDEGFISLSNKLASIRDSFPRTRNTIDDLFRLGKLGGLVLIFLIVTACVFMYYLFNRVCRIEMAVKTLNIRRLNFDQALDLVALNQL